jgi:predicted ArsR family transcriptional regulator
MSEERRTIELTDPRALRALAHPTRLELVGLLRREGPLTATQAAEKVGESPSSCSFHLRQLAKWGLVEEAGGGKGRERPWRATAELTSWNVRTQELAEAASAFSSVVADIWGDKLRRWFQQMPAEPPQWREAHHSGDDALHLTPGELDELGTKVWELVRSYQHEPREGTRHVTFLYALFPATSEDQP